MIDPIIKAIQESITTLNHNSEILSSAMEKLQGNYELLASSMTNVKINMAVLTEQVNQVVWLQRAVLVVAIGFIVAKILQAAFKNNRK